MAENRFDVSDPMNVSVATHGVLNQTSRGRVYQETFPQSDSPFEIDYRRVLSSAAFRRLQYKTQVFISPRGDHFRTRLTHTLEVANIARQLAMELQVNSTLSEVMALTHDLGHPPFGHAGEGALNYLMREQGGFEHNTQSLRVIDFLEHPFPPFRGLNLTYEVREALIKHRTRYDQPVTTSIEDPVLLELLRVGSQPTLEGQIVSLADRLAYDVHDLEDALGAEILTGQELQSVELWATVCSDVVREYPNRSLFAVWRTIAERLRRVLVHDVVSTTRSRIQTHRIASPNQVRQFSEPLVGFSVQTESQISSLEDFLRRRVYEHTTLKRMDGMAARMLTELFNYYLENPGQLPGRYYDRVENQGVHRVVCDYLAGMTDRFCEREYRRIFLPFTAE